MASGAEVPHTQCEQRDLNTDVCTPSNLTAFLHRGWLVWHWLSVGGHPTTVKQKDHGCLHHANEPWHQQAWVLHE